jgi:hypothetical protein
MSDRELHALFEAHADELSYGDGTALCMTWEAFEAAARALLAEAQPEPQGPTDEELLEAAAKALGYKSIPSDETCLTAEASELLAYARAVLARWGRPAPEPVSVAERLPGDQLCWWFEADEDGGYGSNWTLLRIRGSATGYTHWLPHWALPVPQEQADG